MSWSYLGEAMEVDNRYTLAINIAEVHDNVLYNITVTPEPQAVNFIDNSTVHLTLSYGSVYYVVVVATSTLCKNVSMSTVLGWIRNDYDVIVHYGECICAYAHIKLVKHTEFSTGGILS